MKVVGLSLLIFAIFLTSCVKTIHPMLQSRFEQLDGIYVSHDEMFKSDFDSAIDAIKRKDNDALKDLFSETALSNIEDFDSECQKLLDYVEENIASWGEFGGGHTSKLTRYGEIQVRASRFVKLLDTNDRQYRLYMYDYVEDDFDEKNQGVCTLILASYNYVFDEIVDIPFDDLAPGIYMINSAHGVHQTIE